MNAISASTPTTSNTSTSNFIPVERPTENWTKFPNCILDNLDKFTPMECKILMLMVRENYGYQQPNMKFSLTYLCEQTGNSKPTVIKAVDGLLEKESIKVVHVGEKGVRFFDINWVSPKEIGKEILPDTFIKENIKRNDDVSAPPESNLKPKFKYESKVPSSSFSSEYPSVNQHDLDNLMQMVVPKHRTNEVKARLKTALQNGHSVDYLRRCVGYANVKSNGTGYKAYLGKCIDNPEWHDGFDPDTQIRKLQADINKLRKQQAEQRKYKKEQLDLKGASSTIDNIEQNDPTRWRELRLQACENLGINPSRPGRGAVLKIRFEIMRILAL